MTNGRGSWVVGRGGGYLKTILAVFVLIISDVRLTHFYGFQARPTAISQAPAKEHGLSVLAGKTANNHEGA